VNVHDSDLVGAYVLDALPLDELEAFEAHLTECESCRQEVAELSRVVEVLPLAVDQVAPPADLRGQILAAIADEVGEAPVQRPALTAIEGGAPPRRAIARPAPWQTLLAVAAAVVIAVLGWQNLQLQQKVDRLNQNAALAHNVTAAIAAGATQSHIAGTSAQPGAVASLVQPLHQNVAYLIVHGLKPTPPGKVYQIWLVKIRHGQLEPRSAGVFQVSGSAPQIIQIPMSSRGYPAAAVTLEGCPGGCPGPRGPKVLLGQLTA
jgi:anti-sigma-K factor RskA